MTQKELNEIHRLHQLWIDGRREGKRAHFNGEDFNGLNLTGANFYRAYFVRCKFAGAIIEGMNLFMANLEGSDMLFMQLGNHPVYIRPTVTCIGCEEHPNADWKRWLPEDVKFMGEPEPAWWDKYKAVVIEAIKING